MQNFMDTLIFVNDTFVNIYGLTILLTSDETASCLRVSHVQLAFQGYSRLP